MVKMVKTPDVTRRSESAREAARVQHEARAAVGAGAVDARVGDAVDMVTHWLCREIVGLRSALRDVLEADPAVSPAEHEVAIQTAETLLGRG